MKKLSIVILAFLFIGISNINAQTNEVEETTKEISLEENLKANCPDWGTDKCPFTKNDKGELICKKTGKVCDETCKNKKDGTCCNGKKTKIIWIELFLEFIIIESYFLEKLKINPLDFEKKLLQNLEFLESILSPR